MALMTSINDKQQKQTKYILNRLHAVNSEVQLNLYLKLNIYLDYKSIHLG